MTMNTQQSGTHNSNIPLGAKLQSAREAQRLDRKDAAAKLRLNENVIDMIETNSFPDNMPSIFVRGYIRAYGKLLQISDEEIAVGLEPIKPNPVTQEVMQAPVNQAEPARNIKKLAMKAASAVIVLTVFGLMAAWWHGHSAKSTEQTISIAVPQELAAQAPAPIATAPAAPVPPLAAAPLAAPTAIKPPLAAPALPVAAPATVAAPAPAKAPTTVSSVPAYKRAAALSRPPVNLDAEDEKNGAAAD